MNDNQTPKPRFDLSGVVDENVDDELLKQRQPHLWEATQKKQELDRLRRTTDLRADALLDAIYELECTKPEFEALTAQLEIDTVTPSNFKTTFTLLADVLELTSRTNELKDKRSKAAEAYITARKEYEEFLSGN